MDFDGNAVTLEFINAQVLTGLNVTVRDSITGEDFGFRVLSAHVHLNPAHVVYVEVNMLTDQNGQPLGKGEKAIWNSETQTPTQKIFTFAVSEIRTVTK